MQGSKAMTGDDASRRDERRAFWFLTVFAAPILAVLVVSGYGFLVWFSQLLLGPPGS